LTRHRRRNRGRAVNGVVVLDKPKGLSSNEALQAVKRLLSAAKGGHTGSLDPLATGVLPLCFGEATKFSQFLLASDKRYWTKIKLGVRTESGDADGAVLEERTVVGITREDVERVLEKFKGELEQVPSMYSAVKHHGQPLYKLARQGVEVERKPRRIVIYENRLLSFSGDEFEIEIHCSKGTYVRTIAEEIGEILGCGAHVSELRRLQAGPFVDDDSVSMEALEQAHRDAGALGVERYVLPIESAVRDWPEVQLTDLTAYYIRQGQPVIVPHAPASGWVRITEVEDSEERFIGVGEVLDDGRVAPRRLTLTSGHE
jgi:tRNA pseudouridine55 synthase